MSLRMLLGRITSHQAQEVSSRAPMCGAEPSSWTAWSDHGDGFPEITESHRMPCIEQAIAVLALNCPCGHDGTRYSCASHAIPGPDQKCGPCADQYGHLCPVTFTATTPL